MLAYCVIDLANKAGTLFLLGGYGVGQFVSISIASVERNERQRKGDSIFFFYYYYYYVSFFFFFFFSSISLSCLVLVHPKFSMLPCIMTHPPQRPADWKR